MRSPYHVINVTVHSPHTSGTSDHTCGVFCTPVAHNKRASASSVPQTLALSTSPIKYPRAQ